jgi:predicted transcriptional regulator
MMTPQTTEKLETLVQSYRNEGIPLQEALSDIQEYVERQSTLEGVVKGLEDLEAGRTRLLDDEYIQRSQAEFAKKLGV